MNEYNFMSFGFLLLGIFVVIFYLWDIRREKKEHKEWVEELAHTLAETYDPEYERPEKGKK